MSLAFLPRHPPRAGLGLFFRFQSMEEFCSLQNLNPGPWVPRPTGACWAALANWWPRRFYWAPSPEPQSSWELCDSSGKGRCTSGSLLVPTQGPSGVMIRACSGRRSGWGREGSRQGQERGPLPDGTL